ncbi:hypothetical protein MHYP_G00271470 [Metynnis hypsauchen]
MSFISQQHLLELTNDYPNKRGGVRICACVSERAVGVAAAALYCWGRGLGGAPARRKRTAVQLGLRCLSHLKAGLDRVPSSSPHLESSKETLQMENGDSGYMMTDPVTLNVGGQIYTTSLSTLQRYPDSMLGAMFRGDFPTARDTQGNYFIDRDGPLFRYILNFLRTSELTLPYDFKETELLRKEADFYQIEPLIQCLSDTKPLYPLDTFEQVVELSSTRKLSKYSNPVAVIITQLTITTKVHTLLEGISNNFTRWNKHMMDTRDFQVSFTFGPCDYHQEVSLRVHLVEYISKQGFTIRNTRVHHMSERANENTVEHHWTFCRLARKVED